MAVMEGEQMRRGRSPLTMRVTDEGKRLLMQLAERRGISQTAIVEQLIRDEAERKGVRLTDEETEQKEPAATAGKA